MKIHVIETLEPRWERRVWENNQGRYIGSARFHIETDEPIFASVTEEGGKRFSRKGTPLYEALDEEFTGRVGGHPFEIDHVINEREFLVSFRAGYASDPNEGDRDCEGCPIKGICPAYGE